MLGEVILIAETLQHVARYAFFLDRGLQKSFGVCYGAIFFFLKAIQVQFVEVGDEGTLVSL